MDEEEKKVSKHAKRRANKKAKQAAATNDGGDNGQAMGSGQDYAHNDGAATNNRQQD